MVRAYVDQQSKKTVSQVAREHGLGAETLRVWVKAYREANPEIEPPLTVSERARLAELERENRDLRLEREFLGKVAVARSRAARSGLKMGLSGHLGDVA